MAGKKNKTKINVRTLTVTFLLAALLLFYFNHLSNKSAERREKAHKTEIQNLIKYDMVNEYPKTPREVVKLHCRFQKEFYNQDMSDKELSDMNQQVRKLYSEELLEVNPEGNSLVALKNNIEKMEDEGYNYKSYELPQPSQVKTYTSDGKEMAVMTVTLTITIDDKMGYKDIEYVLVKENGRWKILGWADTQMLGDK